MKKIININFQGRIIPIEETAYEILMQYVESLRRYFANEEGRDEIINDIESRIGELFSNRLKNTPCITDDDVKAVITSIGRPEDFDEAEGTQSTGTASSDASSQYNYRQGQQTGTGTRRLHRSANDKIIGGVAGGLANYFGIDPAITRVLFVLFLFIGGGGLLVYIILWAVLPSHNLVTNIRKRLYRDPENKMIGGVASGIAAYFNSDVWIPRVIFLLPFIIGILGRAGRREFMDFDSFPHFLFNGIGGTIFITYIVLWIVLPQANSSTEKLEMRGEKVDLESIKKTVKEDLENLRSRAEKMGMELKERAQDMGQDLKHSSQNFVAETAPVMRRSRSGIGHAIGILFKAFFLFIAGIFVFGLVMLLVALLFSGVGAFSFKDFVLDGFGENLLAWLTLLLFLGIPIIALLTWLVRRIIGVKSRNHYIGYTFGSLWIIGLVSAILLTISIARDFRSRTSVKEDVALNQPATGKLMVKVSESRVKYYDSDWFGFDGEWPFFSKNEDSIMMSTVKVRLIKSNDSSYHAYAVKFSSGKSPELAENLANRISFNVSQTDSLLYLPKGFTVTKDDKFRNQQVMLIVEIPVGKRIEVDKSVDIYNWFTINVNRRRGWNVEWDDRWDNAYYYNSNKEYIMTTDGLKDTEEIIEQRKSRSDNEGEDPGENENNDKENYRYKNHRSEKADSVSTRHDSAKAVYNGNNPFKYKARQDAHAATHPAAIYTVVLMNP